MIKEQKQYEGNWLVWEDKNPEKAVFIVAFNYWFMGRCKTRYRVGRDGQTVDTLLNTKAEAMSSARQAIQDMEVARVPYGGLF
ncbi:hypothetical protein J2T17_007482 [Paenibacillus mucilaginosus]|uniref:hypothetical protein n=1 Tax=Paenibacillus mucilaginosus TaxID=61624 RepID=UPI003D20EC8E